MAILHNRFEKTKTVGEVFGIFLFLSKPGLRFKVFNKE